MSAEPFKESTMGALAERLLVIASEGCRRCRVSVMEPKGYAFFISGQQVVLQGRIRLQDGGLKESGLVYPLHGVLSVRSPFFAHLGMGHVRQKRPDDQDLVLLHEVRPENGLRGIVARFYDFANLLRRDLLVCGSLHG
jgi:hypothetical protein